MTNLPKTEVMLALHLAAQIPEPQYNDIADDALTIMKLVRHYDRHRIAAPIAVNTHRVKTIDKLLAPYGLRLMFWPSGLYASPVDPMKLSILESTFLL